jgi:hypothetical protein
MEELANQKKNEGFGKIARMLCAGVLVCIAFPLSYGAGADKPPADAVGMIEGDAISVEGSMSVEVVRGQVRTILRSGSEVRVKSGQARIDLVEGGQIAICGPAHFSVLKSGGSLTLALDSGTISAHIDNEPALTVYTPQIQAHPLSIGGGPLETLVGLDASGTMCIRAAKGAVRVEQQLTGQSVVVPQSGDISITNGQLEGLRTSAGRCVCEAQPVVRPMPVSVSTEVSVPASTDEIKKMREEKKAAAPATPTAPPVEKPEPIYQVFMPPLQYDANAKVQADYDPNLIILVRRVRVRPTLILQGRVEGDPVVAQVTPPHGGNEQKVATAAAKPAEESTWSRVRTFIRKLWSPNS